jgi:hypothetical protein
VTITVPRRNESAAPVSFCLRVGLRVAAFVQIEKLKINDKKISGRKTLCSIERLLVEGIAREQPDCGVGWLAGFKLSLTYTG